MLGFGPQRALTRIPHFIAHWKVHHIIYLIGTEGDMVKVLAWPVVVLKTKRTLTEIYYAYIFHTFSY